MTSQPQVFGYYETCSWNMLRKGDGMWSGGGLAWASGLHGILVLLPFSSQAFQQSVSQKDSVDFLGSLSPGRERTSLFSLRPHALFQMVNWLLSSFGSFCRGFGTSFMLQLSCPCQLISIDLAHNVPNKAEGSQARPQ